MKKIICTYPSVKHPEINHMISLRVHEISEDISLIAISNETLIDIINILKSHNLDVDLA